MANATLSDGTLTETFAIINGRPQPLQERLTDITRKIADGHWSKRIGKRSEEFQIFAVTTVADADAAKVKIDTDYPAILSGSSKKLVTLTDHAGDTWANIALLDFEVVENLNTSTIAGVVTASDAQVLMTRWRAQVMN